MRIIAIGTRALVSGFQLAGVEGIPISTPREAYTKITELLQAKDVGLILLGSDVARPLRLRLAELRKRYAVPLIYEVPAPGEKLERVEYRDILKQILGV